MSLRDELKNALDAQGVNYDALKIDKDVDYKGRSSTKVGFIINGDAGPVFFDASFADDLKLTDTEAAVMIAKNAHTAYINHVRDSKEKL